MIARLTRLGLELGASQDIEAAKREFAARCCIQIKGFLAPDLVSHLQHGLTRAAFARRVHHGVKIGEPPVDVVLTDEALLGRVLFLLNDPALFRFVRAVTGCDPIGCFMPTIFKMMASDGHFDTWHDDVDGNHMVALSVNLTAETFEGGVFQIMEKDSSRVLCEIANTGPGDALLFLVSPDLLHKVADVTGNVPRTVLAGWFQREPDYSTLYPWPLRTA